MKTKIYAFAVALMLSSISLFAQQKEVNTSKSTITWLGKKIGGQHEGGISLKSGQLTEKNDKITSGIFVVDMNSMTNTDITNETYSQKLVDHLKSDDFFGVEKFPTATLKVTKSKAFKNGKANVTGDLTIKGKTESITFEMVKENESYTAIVNIDRSKFDIRYGSKSFFDNLGDKAIHDIFTLNISLILN